MNASPLFSFVIPVYGTEDRLGRCLDSVFAQSARNYEVIVVDDGSPGDCRNVVVRYGARVRSVRHETNRSLLQARLTGLQHAVGKYVIPLDSDDCVYPELTARLAETAEKAGCPDVIEYGIDGGSDYYFKTQPPACRSGREALESVCRAECSWNVCGKAILREVYLNAVKRPEFVDFYLNMGEDLLQSVAILSLAKRCAYCDYVGYGYLQNGDSITLSEKLSFEKCLRRVEASSACLDHCVSILQANVCGSGGSGMLTPVRRKMIEWDLGASYGLADEERERLLVRMCEEYGEFESVIAGFLAVIRRERDGEVKWWQGKFEKCSEELYHAQQRVIWLEQQLKDGATRTMTVWLAHWCQRLRKAAKILTGR